MTVSCEEIFEATGLTAGIESGFSALGLLDSSIDGTLSFAEQEKFLRQAEKNQCIAGVFITPDIVPKVRRKDINLIVCEDARYSFYTLYNYCAAKRYRKTASVVHHTAEIHPSAYVAENNVQIGASTRVEAGAIILPDVVIKNDCLIGPGAVLGCDDAEIKTTSKGNIRVIHDGRLLIGERVDIGANCTIDKGFSYRDTVIGDDTKVATTTSIGHGAHIGQNCRLLCCTILGSSAIGNNVRINPRAVVSNQVTVGDDAVISLGAVVVRPVPEGGHVTGNFAVDHTQFIYEMAKTYGRF